MMRWWVGYCFWRTWRRCLEMDSRKVGGALLPILRLLSRDRRVSSGWWSLICFLMALIRSLAEILITTNRALPNRKRTRRGRRIPRSSWGNRLLFKKTSFDSNTGRGNGGEDRQGITESLGFMGMARTDTRRGETENISNGGLHSLTWTRNTKGDTCARRVRQAETVTRD